MRILYLDCGMGAAGDMLAGALLELLPDPDKFVTEINSLGIPGVAAARSKCERCGINGTRFSVTVYGEAEDECSGHVHEHRGLADIERIIFALPVSERVKENALGVYRLIAGAESRVHNRGVSEVHFHEVGALDAIADIVSVSMLIERLAPDRIIASPVCVGSGQVKCLHGILPVPAPATALLLMGVPVFGGDIAGEMCTPTGAALLKHFVSEFGTMPAISTDAVGYGMGGRDYGTANCVRAFVGAPYTGRDGVTELKCNLDDMTPEAIGFAQERLFENGALDVYTIPIGMKKSRPGVQLCCMCREGDKEKMVDIMFKHTSTAGIRISHEERIVMARSDHAVQTGLGPVRVKKTHIGGIERIKAEYEDLAKIARENDITLSQAADLLNEK